MSSSEQPREPLPSNVEGARGDNALDQLFFNARSRPRPRFGLLHSHAHHGFRHLLRDLEVQQPRWRIEIRRSNESEEANPNEGGEFDDLPELEPSNGHGEVNDVSDNEAVNETVNDDHEGEQESIEHHFYARRNPAPRPRTIRITHPHRPRWMSRREGGRERVELGDANPNEGYHDYDLPAQHSVRFGMSYARLTSVSLVRPPAPSV